MKKEEVRIHFFFPSTCGSEQNEGSQKYPRSAVAAVSCALESSVFFPSLCMNEGALFAFLPVHSSLKAPLAAPS